MKIFIYKTIFVTICIFFLYQLTIGKKINYYENQIKNLTNDQGRDNIRNKLRTEIKKANEKDQILNEEDRKIINKFLDKISKELNQN